MTLLLRYKILLLIMLAAIGIGVSAPAAKAQLVGKIPINSQTYCPQGLKSSNYTLTAQDCTINVTGTTTITIPTAVIGPFWSVLNTGAGVVTFLPNSGTINGVASLTASPFQGYLIWCNGTNCTAASLGGSTILNLNNTWTGINTFNAAVNLAAGGSLAGTFTGNPTLSGNPIFSGTPSFTGNPTFSGNPSFLGLPTFSNLVPGNCVQAGAGGDLTTIATPCNIFATIGGSIANTQVGFGCGVNTLCGQANFIFNSTTGDLSVPAINNTVYLDGVKYTTLQGCLTAAGANGTCVVPPNTSTTVGSAITVATNSTTLRCEPGSIITKGGNFDLLTVTGSFDVIDSCTMDGVKASFNGGGIVLNGAINPIVKFGTFKNFQGLGAVYLGGTSNAQVLNNSFSANLNSAIFGQQNANETLVQGNFIDASTSSSADSAILFHGTTGSQTVNNLKIVDNDIANGAAFCVEVGGFSGGDSLRNIISQNTCVATKASEGGYSVGSNSQYVNISDNSFDSGNNTVSVGGIEMGGGISDSVAVGNTIHFQSGLGSIGFPIVLDATAQRVVVDANTINGFSGGVGTGGIVLSTSISNGVMSDNVISNNIVQFPLGNAGIGIWLQCSNASAECVGNSFTGNHIIGDSTANSTAVGLDDTSGTENANEIGPNNIEGTSIGVKIGSSSITNTRLIDGSNTATTPISDSGTGTGYAFSLLANGCGQFAASLLTSTGLSCGGGSGSSLFTSYQFGTTPAMTISGTYAQFLFPTIFNTTQSGSGTSGSPYLNSLNLVNESDNVIFAGPCTGASATPTFRVLCNADIPTPTTSALGGIVALSGPVSNQFETYVDVSGIQHTAQVSFSNLSGSATCAQLPAFTGDTTSLAGFCATTTGAVHITVANAASTGTTVNKLASLTGAPSTAVITTAGATGGVVGLVTSGAGTTGSASIQVEGIANCAFDGGTTAGDYVQISSSVNGDCTDAGSTYPTSGYVAGRVLITHSGAGSESVDLFPPEIDGGTGGGSSLTIDTNSVLNSSQSLLNFTNSSGAGQIDTSNPSGGVEQFVVHNTATTVNGQTCTLASTCTVPFQTNGSGNTSQAGINLLTSTSNSVGLTVTPVNSATNAEKFEITGGSYTGNAATATKWTTARNLAGNSTDGSANVPFVNKFIVQGTTDAGLTGAQFLGALGTGIIKNTTTTGVLSIAIGSDLPTGIPIANVGSAGLSGTSPIAINSAGAISCPTCFPNVLTTLGDLLYGGASGTPTRLAGTTAPGVYTLVEVPASGAATAETLSLAGVVPNPQTGTTYTYLSTDSTQDRAGYTTFSNASSIAVTLPAAGSTGFGSNWVNKSCNIGAGAVTITPTTSTVSYTTGSSYTSAATSVALTTGQCLWIYSNNSNYFANKDTGGVGNTTSTSLTTGVVPKANGANSIVNSDIDDGVTISNVDTLGASAGASVPNGPLTVGTGGPACTPGTGGGHCYGEGTAPGNVSGAAAIYADSTAHELEAATNGTSNFGLLVRAQPGKIHSTGNTGSISTATLCASAAGACNTAGQYHIQWTFIESGTACTIPTTGGVTFLLTWTDTNGTSHSAVSLGMDDASAINAVSQTFHFQTSLGAAWGSGDFNISTNGAIIQYATGYTACGTGTGTYQLDTVVTRVQ